MANTTGKKFGGRKAGTPNKLTANIKAAIEAAFDEVGGPAYLAQVARDDPKTFCALLGKALPLQVTGEDGGGVVIQVVTGVAREPGAPSE